MVADLEVLGDDGRVWKSTSKKLNVKEVPFPKEEGEFIFPNSRWTNQKPLEKIRN